MGDEFIINPEVNKAREFLEIAGDFSNPLELVREAISNAFDWGAKNIRLDFREIRDKRNKPLLKIEIIDDGEGMDKEGLQSFFDLGNSMARAKKKDGQNDTIGEKGHGTKIYFDSDKVEVFTAKVDGEKYHAVMEEPSDSLYEDKMPTVRVEIEDNIDGFDGTGTKIVIEGYNNNNSEFFNHDRLKDYIRWFTKFGSIEKCFGKEENANAILQLRGVDKEGDFEQIEFGHYFPEESKSVDKLFEEHMVDAPKYYCKKFIREGSFKSRPAAKYQIVFYIEGTRVKHGYNNMIRRSGYSAPEGAYTIQERYGLWLCKDYIPIQQKNEWISEKGNEYTRFHAFINCQELRLTANRGSVDNTSPEVMDELRSAVEKIFNEILEGDDWSDLEWLETEKDAYKTKEKEKVEFERRLKKINKTQIAEYKVSEEQTITLVEPKQENGVFSIFMQLSTYDPKMFPFTIIDYDTHFGIDVIVKANDNKSVKNAKFYYVEFKNYLTKDFNHSFENVHSIVCWDISKLAHGDEITDLAKDTREFQIIEKTDEEGDYTRYYLDSKRSERKIEIFVLKYYLKEKFGISFEPRTEKSVY